MINGRKVHLRARHPIFLFLYRFFLFSPSIRTFFYFSFIAFSLDESFGGGNYSPCFRSRTDSDEAHVRRAAIEGRGEKRPRRSSNSLVDASVPCPRKKKKALSGKDTSPAPWNTGASSPQVIPPRIPGGCWGLSRPVLDYTFAWFLFL